MAPLSGPTDRYSAASPPQSQIQIDAPIKWETTLIHSLLVPALGAAWLLMTAAKKRGDSDCLFHCLGLLLVPPVVGGVSFSC